MGGGTRRADAEDGEGRGGGVPALTELLLVAYSEACLPVWAFTGGWMPRLEFLGLEALVASYAVGCFSRGPSKGPKG